MVSFLPPGASLYRCGLERTREDGRLMALPLFPLCHLVATPAALTLLSRIWARYGREPPCPRCLSSTRYWGDVLSQDACESKFFLEYGYRIIS